MAVEATEAAIVLTGNDIRAYTLLARKGALKLETLGMHRRGRSAYSLCKEIYGLKGNKQKVLEQMEALCAKVVSHEISCDDLPAQ